MYVFAVHSFPESRFCCHLHLIQVFTQLFRWFKRPWLRLRACNVGLERPRRVALAQQNETGLGRLLLTWLRLRACDVRLERPPRVSSAQQNGTDLGRLLLM